MKKNKMLTLVTTLTLGLLTLTEQGCQTTPKIDCTTQPTNQTSHARKAKDDIRALHEAIDLYITRYAGQRPKDLSALTTPDTMGFRVVDIARIPKDPWGNDYVFKWLQGRGIKYVLYSLGPDGVDRSGDEISIRTNLR